MLYDPRHDKTPSIAGFALFCASKPANETYHWLNCDCCSVGQYLKFIDAFDTSFPWRGEIQTMNQLARGGNAGDLPDSANWTFGKLADRILQYQMSFEKV